MSYIYPSDIACAQNTNAVLSFIQKKRSMNHETDALQKILKYDASEFIKNVDTSEDELSLCSVTDSIFSDDDSDLSMCSISGEDSFSGKKNDLNQFCINVEMFDEFEDKDLPTPKNSNAQASILPATKSYNIGKEASSFECKYMHNKGIVTPDSQNQSPVLKPQNINSEVYSYKYTFNDLLTKLEISMRRTEVTRSEVLKQNNLFYQMNNAPFSTIDSTAFPCNKLSILPQYYNLFEEV